MLWLLIIVNIVSSVHIKETMFQEDVSLYQNNQGDSDDSNYDYEYNIYDVTPDVSIDFVSFTTEESEGRIQKTTFSWIFKK